MKKKYSCLLTFLFFTSTVLSQNVQWFPTKDKIFGDIKQIVSAEEYPTIKNQFGVTNLPMNQYPKYLIDSLWYNADEYYINDTINVTFSRLHNPKFYSDDDTNSVVIEFFDTTNSVVHDTAYYYYSGPNTICNSIDETPFSENMVIFNPQQGELTIDLVLYSTYHTINPSEFDGNDKINQIKLLKNGVAEITNIPSDRYIEKEIKITVPEEPGIYVYKISCIGAKESPDLPDEFSNSIHFEILITDFSIKNQSDFTVCQYNKPYTLIGDSLPGGKFRGGSVIENSNVFNPTLVSSGSSTIFYDYNYKGTIYTTSHEITINNVPEIEITGPHEVCGNEHGVVFELEDDSLTDTTDTWVIPNSIIHDDDVIYSPGEVKVNFKQEGSGKLIATAETENGCFNTIDFIVNIGYYKAPKDSAEIILIDRALFCSDTSVNYYYWYQLLTISGEEEYLGMTYDKPYIYIQNNLLPGDSVFFVRTAYDTSGCTTHSKYSTIGKALKNIITNPLVTYVDLFPNPTTDILTITSEIPLENVDIHVKNILGEEILNKHINQLSPYEGIKIDFGPFVKGVYLISLENESHIRTEKIIVK